MNKILLKKIFKYLKKDIALLIVSIILAAAVVGLTIYLPILFGKAIDSIDFLNKSPLLYDSAKSNLNSILTKALIVIVLTGILQWIMMIINNKMTYNITRRLRVDAFRKIENLPLSYLDSHKTGEIVSVVINDVDQFIDGLLLGFTQLFTGLATIIGTIFIMLYINYIIAIVVIVVTPVSLFVAKFIATHTYDMFKMQSISKAKQTGFIDEMITNLKVVKAYNHEDENIEKFDKMNNELADYSFKATFYSSLVNPSTRFVNSLVYALVALAGAIFAVKFRNNSDAALYITVGTLSSLLSYANQYTKPFNEISSVVTELQNAFACIDRVFNLLEETEEIKDSDSAFIIDKAVGEVELEHVYFSYTENQKLIEDFNLHVKPGQRIAIVGPTGCGKTTLINLLMRFYDVNSGSIIVDNHNIKDVTRKSLHINYGMVLQDTWIKNASVIDNIRLGNKDATYEEVVEACKKAHAHHFIERLPNGYDTIIKEEGNLSQGEKQLLCIARIMLLLPPMLILDEATSSIDTRTELKIQEAFYILMKDKTSFVVAHRLSTIKSADIILVMNNGNIIEQGSHEELLKLNGFYANLYNSQFVKY